MKKTFVLLFIFILSSHLYSQNYKPLLDTYNEWNVRFCYASVCDTDIYYTNGDTLVDGLNYKILDGYHYISRGFLLREDLSEKKVYLKAILPSGTYNYLLYDFSLEVGDSIDMKNPVTPFPEDGGYFKVDSIIPRPLMDGNNYDHFYFSPAESNTVSTNNAIWVEGVGSLSIITAPGGDPDIDGVGRTACVFKNGDSFYSDLDIIDECQPTFELSTPNFSTEKPSIKVVSTSEKNVYDIVNVSSFKSIQLYDIKGMYLETFSINREHSKRINLTEYSAGIYVLIFKSEERQSQNLKMIFE